MNLKERDILEIKEILNDLVLRIEKGLGPQKKPIEYIPKDNWITVAKFKDISGIETNPAKSLIKNLASVGKIEINKSTLGKSGGVVVNTKIKRKSFKKQESEAISFFDFIKSFQKIWLRDYSLGLRIDVEVIISKLMRENLWLTKKMSQSFLKDLYMIYPKRVILEPSLNFKSGIEISGEMYSTIVLLQSLI